MKRQFRTMALLLIALLALSATLVAAQGDEEDMSSDGVVIVLSADGATMTEEEIMLEGVFPKASATYDIADEYYFRGFDLIGFNTAFTSAEVPNELGEVSLYIDSDQANFMLTATIVAGDDTSVTFEIIDIEEAYEYTADGLVALDKPLDDPLTNVSVFVILEGEDAISFGENLQYWMDNLRTTGTRPSCIPGISC